MEIHINMLRSKNRRKYLIRMLIQDTRFLFTFFLRTSDFFSLLISVHFIHHHYIPPFYTTYKCQTWVYNPLYASDQQSTYVAMGNLLHQQVWAPLESSLLFSLYFLVVSFCHISHKKIPSLSSRYKERIQSYIIDEYVCNIY